MKKVLIVGNFKSNKTSKQAEDWLEEFAKEYTKTPEKEVVICPSFTSLSGLFKKISEKRLDIFLGSQDVSLFEGGPITGEINANQLKEFCKYSLVGHSERREKFSEDLGSLNSKISNLIRAEIIPILCISEETQLEEILNLEKCFIAYEPLEAIGSGVPQDPAVARNILNNLRKKESLGVLYGGSVEPNNVSRYTAAFDGVLVGTNSLDPSQFLKVLNNA